MIENNLDKIGSYNAHFLEESRKKMESKMRVVTRTKERDTYRELHLSPLVAEIDVHIIGRMWLSCCQVRGGMIMSSSGTPVCRRCVPPSVLLIGRI